MFSGLTIPESVGYNIQDLHRPSQLRDSASCLFEHSDEQEADYPNQLSDKRDFQPVSYVSPAIPGESSVMYQYSRMDCFVFDQITLILDGSLFRTSQASLELKVTANIRIDIRGAVIRILVTDPCIQAIIPIAT